MVKVDSWQFMVCTVSHVSCCVRQRIWYIVCCVLCELDAFVEQIDELLGEMKPKTKKIYAVRHFVEKLQSILLHMKQAKRQRQVLIETKIISVCLLEICDSCALLLLLF